MFQVSATLEIPKDCFTILLKEGITIVYKTEIKFAHFFPQDSSNLNEEELQLLNKFLEEKKITKPAPETEPKKEKTDLQFDPKDSDHNLIVPPLGTYECGKGKCSNNNIGTWD
ncbi:hypothetical protein SUGI_0432870 [Cryptomeria japonica]|nr:hypothetical protein SUGI_0432870 [Cryptomeria japonica]